MHQKLLDVLKIDKLYDDRFQGWGGEDSRISITTWKMHHHNLIKKVINFDMWYHLWHDRDCGFGEMLKEERNVRHLKRRRGITERLRTMIEKSIGVAG